MSRAKDELKKNQILNVSKKLIAQNGFHNTSISDIVRETGFPVGTIYTYFKNKEEIIETIVQAGWDDFYRTLKDKFKNAKDPNTRLKILIDDIFPQLLQDVDFINILITEGVNFTGIEDKIDKITDIIYKLILDILKNSSISNKISKSYMRTAIVIFFLGILNTVKLSESKKTGINTKKIISFLRITISQSLGVDIWKNIESQ